MSDAMPRAVDGVRLEQDAIPATLTPNVLELQ